MTAYEEILERRIGDAYDAFVSAKTREGQQAAWTAMVQLCEQRTAERILAMEQEKGLVS